MRSKIREIVDPTHKSLELAMLDQHIAGLFKGKEYAYAGVSLDDGGFGLGIAVRNEPGFTPVPEKVYRADSFSEASLTADGMNMHIGVSVRDAVSIIGSSMIAQKWESYKL